MKGSEPIKPNLTNVSYIVRPKRLGLKVIGSKVKVTEDTYKMIFDFTCMDVLSVVLQLWAKWGQSSKVKVIDQTNLW